MVSNCVCSEKDNPSGCGTVSKIHKVPTLVPSGVTNGAPIGIGWNYVVQDQVVPVDEWELQNPVKRSSEELKLSKHECQSGLRNIRKLLKFVPRTQTEKKLV